VIVTGVRTSGIAQPVPHTPTHNVLFLVTVIVAPYAATLKEEQL